MVGARYFSAVADDGGDALGGVEIGGIMDPESVMAREVRSEALKKDAKKLRDYLEKVLWTKVPDLQSESAKKAAEEFFDAIVLARVNLLMRCDELVAYK